MKQQINLIGYYTLTFNRIDSNIYMYLDECSFRGEDKADNGNKYFHRNVKDVSYNASNNNITIETEDKIFFFEPGKIVSVNGVSLINLNEDSTEVVSAEVISILSEYTSMIIDYTNMQGELEKERLNFYKSSNIYIISDINQKNTYVKFIDGISIQTTSNQDEALYFNTKEEAIDCIFNNVINGFGE